MPDHIVDFERRFGTTDFTRHVAKFLTAQQSVGQQPADLHISEQGAPVGPPLIAEVRAGRWCAVCDACAGGEYVCVRNPVFMCTACFNEDNGYRWRPVVLPTDAERHEIERLLLARPVKYRHFMAGETVADLALQNAQLGVEV